MKASNRTAPVHQDGYAELRAEPRLLLRRHDRPVAHLRGGAVAADMYARNLGGAEGMPLAQRQQAVEGRKDVPAAAMVLERDGAAARPLPLPASTDPAPVIIATLPCSLPAMVVSLP